VGRAGGRPATTVGGADWLLGGCRAAKSETKNTRRDQKPKAKPKALLCGGSFCCGARWLAAPPSHGQAAGRAELLLLTAEQPKNYKAFSMAAALLEYGALAVRCAGQPPSDWPYIKALHRQNTQGQPSIDSILSERGYT
jgi:hypothetical protein